MDNKVTKKRINDHLEYDWYKYLILLVAICFLVYFVFSQINRTRDYEDVALFVSCYEANDNAYVDRVRMEMRSDNYRDNLREKYGENVLRKISIETQDPESNTYGTMLSTHGDVTSDILIVGKSVLQNSGVKYVELTDTLLRDYLLPEETKIDDYEYFTYTGEDGSLSYRSGIKVSDFLHLPFTTDWKKVESYAEKYKDETDPAKLPDDEFYLVLNRSSVSIGGFGGKKSKEKNAQALYLVNRFIAYYNRV